MRLLTLLCPLALALNGVTAFAAVTSVTKNAEKVTPVVSKAGLPQAAATGSDQPRRSVFDDPLGGIVVNRTVTVLGKDFYQYFSSRWRQKDISGQYTISIHERPSARFGSEIWVQFRQKRMFHAFLPPARAATKKISWSAVELVYQNINDSEIERIMVKTPDLGPEEM
ncbi:hypothetical protein CR159_13150 [Pollutimonas subterranea]|uniref:Curli production assembly/transport component CsgE n=1 Tax=Pollutimonas subterranea TaxID=2045210 RepID=A0A2N4U3D6_9BURK|nr:curli production assembly/transport protein CsgE [Pollutimonas subterranea]PLC49542.1 hypothetical protein CR159_13150 [Pollutimonas subterranea]